MDKQKLEYFKGKLTEEKERVSKLLYKLKENEVIDSNEEMTSSELSFYDNHPADLATELFDKEKGLALKQNEMTIIKKIDDSLKNIEEGNYGKCSRCGCDIPEERLEFIPYTEYCTSCQQKLIDIERGGNEDRPVEETVLGRPFGYGYNDYDDKVGFDAEDSYQSVEKFNRMENIVEFYDDDDEYVESVEKISNQQYKNQLPD